jgi:NADH-quinone oxidoreductase subunit A
MVDGPMARDWPLLLFAGLVVVTVSAMLLLSTFLGERHEGRETGEPYESGMPTTGTARTPYPAQFYLVAVFFLIFDLEAVFLFAWAVAAEELGWRGYVEALVFIGVLLAALVYLWKEGALDWGPTFKLLKGGPGEARAARPVDGGKGGGSWTGG